MSGVLLRMPDVISMQQTLDLLNKLSDSHSQERVILPRMSKGLAGLGTLTSITWFAIHVCTFQLLACKIIEDGGPISD